MNPANDNRPAEFDAMLVAHIPYVRKAVAYRANSSEPREEYVQIVLMKAMERWANYRTSDSFRQWLKWIVRQTLTNQRSLKKITVAMGGMEDLPQQATGARQHNLLEAKMVVEAAMQSDILSAIALGETTPEIAASRGVHRNAIRQAANRHREKYLAKFVEAA